MNGGANQDMEIGGLAWKGIHFVEMACTTRSVKHQNFHNHFIMLDFCIE